MKKNTRKHESGRSMIEMVGVLAVMGLLTAGAFVLIQSGMQSQRRSRAADEVATMVAEMQNIDVTKLERDIDTGKKTVAEFGWTTTTPLGSGTSYSIWRDTDSGKTGIFHVGITGLDTNTCSALSKRAWSGEPKNVSCDAKNNLDIQYVKDGGSGVSSIDTGNVVELGGNGGRI